MGGLRMCNGYASDARRYVGGKVRGYENCGQNGQGSDVKV
jgi:hypothetical protein